MQDSIFITLEKSSDPFFRPHCQLKRYANEIVKLKVVIESLSENLSSLQSIIMSPEHHTNEAMSTNTMSEPPSFDPTRHQRPQIKPVSLSPLHSVGD